MKILILAALLKFFEIIIFFTVQHRLDLGQVISVGHSFGGASALAACAAAASRDAFSACVLLDAWLYPLERDAYAALATHPPLLMLCASQWQWARNVRRMQYLQQQRLQQEQTCCNTMMFTIK